VKFIKTLFLAGACASLVSCGSGDASNALSALGIQTLTAGQSITIAADDTYLVPAGTTIRAPNGGTVTTISGHKDSFKVPRGSTVTVSATPSGAADNTVTGI
jgi:hypothetical protein